MTRYQHHYPHPHTAMMWWRHHFICCYYSPYLDSNEESLLVILRLFNSSVRRCGWDGISGHVVLLCGSCRAAGRKPFVSRNDWLRLFHWRKWLVWKSLLGGARRARKWFVVVVVVVIGVILKIEITRNTFYTHLTRKQ